LNKFLKTYRKCKRLYTGAAHYVTWAGCHNNQTQFLARVQSEFWWWLGVDLRTLCHNIKMWRERQRK